MMRIHTVVVAAMLLAFTTSAHASHSSTHETGWFEYQFNEDDDSVLYCTALGVVPLGADLYLHDRPGPGASYGTGTLSEGGGGTFIFQESNGIPGIQIGSTSTVESRTGVSVLEQEVADLTVRAGFGDPFDRECPNGDTLVFAVALALETNIV